MALRRTYGNGVGSAQRRIGMFRALRVVRVDNLTANGNAAATIGTKLLKPYGMSVIAIGTTGTGGTHKYGLPAPGVGSIGQEKRVVITLKPGASTVDVGVVNVVNATKFFGSTANAMLFSTAALQATVIDLVAVSSAQWAVMSPQATTGGKRIGNYVLTNLTS